MKRIMAIGILLTLIPFYMPSNAAPPTTGNEIYGVAVDSHGNVVVTGSITQGDATIIRTQKYDANGNIIWQKDWQKEGVKTNVGEAVAIDKNGNIYVGGIVGAGYTPSQLASLFTNYIILKYDSNGHLLWYKEYDKHFADLLRDIAVDDNGNVYATGVTIKVDLQSNQPSNLNFWTIKVDGRTGSLIAQDEYDHGGTDAAFGMTIKGNTIVVVGGTEENNQTKLAVVKYDTNLNKQWEKFYGKDAAATDCVILNDGSIAVSGNKGTKFWTLLLDSNGNEKWDKTDGTAFTDYSLGIALDSNENIIVGNHVVVSNIPKWHIIKYGKDGSVKWEKTYDIQGGIRSVATYGNSIIAGGYMQQQGTNKFLLIKFDSNGNKVWEGHGVVEELKADFSFYPTNPTRNEVVHFTDLSTGGATSWLWDFGDGTTSNQQNPTHEYTQLGTYTVKLTVKNAAGDTDTKTREIVVVNAPPEASFSYNPLNPIVNQTITFDASASSDIDGVIANYTWNFGDGGVGYGKIVKHSYTKGGSYKVELKVKDNDGATNSVSRMITVNNQTGNKPPIANFVFTPSNPSVGDEVTFNASSSYDPDGHIVLYKWDWNGDGKFDSSYTQPIAKHSWSKAGKYVVTLQVIDNASLSNTVSKTVEVKEKEKLILTAIKQIEVKKGEEKLIKVVVKNGYPYAVKINLVVEKSNGINVTVLDKNITLQPDEKKEMAMKINAENGGSITVYASGNGGEESNAATIKVTINKSTPGFVFIYFIAAILAVVLLRRKWKT